MANNHGPTRGDLWLRLAAGLGGIGLMIAAVCWRVLWRRGALVCMEAVKAARWGTDYRISGTSGTRPSLVR